MNSPHEVPRLGVRRSRRIELKVQECTVEHDHSSEGFSQIQDDDLPYIADPDDILAESLRQGSLCLDNMMTILHQLFQDYLGHAEEDLNKDEDLTCPVHLGRPSLCPTRDCPAPITGPKCSRPELLQAQSFDDSMEPSEFKRRLVELLKHIPSLHTLISIRTIVVPILDQGVWRVLILTIGNGYVTSHFYELRINGRSSPINLTDEICEAVKVTFQHLTPGYIQEFSCDRVLKEPRYIRCKAIDRTRKSASSVIELLTTILSEQLRLPKSVSAKDTKQSWTARFEQFVLSQPVKYSPSEPVVCEGRASRAEVDQMGQANNEKASEDQNSQDSDDESYAESVSKPIAVSAVDDKGFGGPANDGLTNNRHQVMEADENSDWDNGDDVPFIDEILDDTMSHKDLASFSDDESDASDVFTDSDLNEISDRWAEDEHDIDQDEAIEGSRTTRTTEKLADDQNHAAPLDEDPHVRASRLLGAEYLQARQLTPAQKDDILARLGPKPTLDTLSKEGREKVERCLRRYRRWLGNTLERISIYTCGSPRGVNKNYYDPTVRPWHIANGLPETKDLVLDLLTDPRVTSYQSQIARGCCAWDLEQFRRAGLIKPEDDYADCGDVWGVYSIDITIPRKSTNDMDGNGDCLFRYTGSSTGGYGRNGLVGMRSRIVSGHENMICRLQNATPERTRELRQNATALFVHEVAAQHGAKRFFSRTMTFPIIQEANILQKQVKQLILLSELAMMALDYTFDERALFSPKSKLPLATVRSLRAADAPPAPWFGANRSLPTDGGKSLLAEIAKKDSLQEILGRIFDEKKRNWLEVEDLKHAQAEYSRLNPDAILPIQRELVRRSFQIVLARRGVRFVPWRERRLLSLLPLFASVKEHMEVRLATIKGIETVTHKPLQSWTYGESVKALKEHKMRLNWTEITSRLKSATQGSGGWSFDVRETHRIWSVATGKNDRLLLQDQNWEQISCE